MTPLQTLELRMGDLRKQLAELIGATEPDTTAIEAKTGEIRATDALLVAQKVLEPEPKPEVTTATAETAEERALVELRSKVEFGKYVSAALAGMPVMGGAELELNQHLNIAPNFFPLELIAGEHRAARDGDGEGNQGT